MSYHHSYTTYPLNQNSDIQEHWFDFPQFPLEEQVPILHNLHQTLLPNPPLWNPCTNDPSMQVFDPIPTTLINAITPNNIEVGMSSGSREKKNTHKHVERRRRKEMNTLYATLRSLIPPGYLKGKRSISDHMNEATHYIKHLEKKIKELGEKREMLKGTSIASNCSNGNTIISSGSGVGETGSSSSAAIIKIQETWPGVEIVIDGSWVEGKMPLSKVLQWLVCEGFDVISCNSCKVNNSIVCTLKCEVNNLESQNLHELKKKLMDLISSDMMGSHSSNIA